jgi:hypothetical protein
MKCHKLLLLFVLGFTPLHAEEPQAPTAAEKPDTAPSGEAARLESFNKLATETLTQETNGLRAEIAKLKLERELITEKLALESAKRKEAVKDAVAESEIESGRLTRESELSRIRSEKLAADLKSIQSEAALELTRLQSEMQTIEAILNEIDDKTGLAQALAQIIARFRLILDNQNFH